MKKHLLVLVLGIIALTAGCTQTGDTTGEGEGMKNRIAVFDTSMGTFRVELYEDLAPVTSGNFISLAEKGFFNGLVFHRVIDEFMIQGGDPNGDGTGGPGYTIRDEFGPGLRHDSEGILSMANRGPNTGGSQFFITLVPTPWLDGKHAIFGKVVQGIEVVRAIGKVETDSMDRPLEPVVINSVSIGKQ
jgi:peptidyl-prolyl cis-trans isomerase A (cyclophilin A)